MYVQTVTISRRCYSNFLMTWRCKYPHNIHVGRQSGCCILLQTWSKVRICSCTLDSRNLFSHLFVVQAPQPSKRKILKFVRTSASKICFTHRCLVGMCAYVGLCTHCFVVCLKSDTFSVYDLITKLIDVNWCEIFFLFGYEFSSRCLKIEVRSKIAVKVRCFEFEHEV